MGSVPQVTMAGRYLQGNWLLLRFYIKNISKVHSLPKWMRNPDTLKNLVNSKIDLGEQEHFSLSLPNNIAKEYNGGLEDMKADMRKLHAGEKESFS